MTEPVQVQRQKLLQQIAAQRQEINSLHERLSHVEQQQQDYQQTILFVNRSWEQLNDDVLYLLSRSSGTALPPLSGSTTAANSPDQLANIQDPFLRRLLRSADSSACKAVQDGQRAIAQGMSDVERHLDDRLNTTKASLANLIAQLDASKQPQSIDTAPLKRNMDSLRALQRNAQEQLRQSDDKVLELQQKVRDLTTQLAEREQQVLNLVKKLNSGSPSNNRSAATAAALGMRNAQPGSNSAAAAAAAGEAMALLQKDLADAQEQLQQTKSLLDSEREAHLRTQRELQQAAARGAEEAQIAASPLYQQRLREIESLNAELARKSSEAEALLRERDAALEGAQGRQQLEAAERRCAAQLQAAQKTIAQLTSAKQEVERAKQEAEVALQAERAAAARSQTVGELQSLLAALQRDLAAHKAKDQAGRGAVDKLAAAAKEVQEANVKLETKCAEVRRLGDKLRAKSAQLAEASKVSEQQREAAEDLRAFVEVLTTFCDDPRDLAAVRASEAALRTQLAQLRAEGAGADPQGRMAALQAQLKAAEELAAAREAQVDELEGKLAGAQAQAQQLSEQVSHLRADISAYASEIESSTSAYEEMQALNSSLVASAVQKDEEYSRLCGERAKLVQGQQLLASQLAEVRQEVARLQEEARSAQQLQEAAAADVAKLRADLAAANEQARLHYSRAEGLLAQLAARSQEAGALAVQLEAARQEAGAHKRQADEEAERHQRECVKRQRLEEEHACLAGSVEQLRRMASQSSAVKELELEIAAFRKILNCSVCGERRKNTVIVKCGHAFCAECVKKNVESRNRKCPGCGHQFGGNDHRPLFLT